MRHWDLPITSERHSRLFTTSQVVMKGTLESKFWSSGQNTKVPTSRCRQWSFTTPSHVEIMKTFKRVWRLALIWYSAGSAWSAVANVSVVGPLRLTSTRTKSEVLETGESTQWAVEWKTPDGCYTEKEELLHKDTRGQKLKWSQILKTCNFVKGIVQ